MEQGNAKITLTKKTIIISIITLIAIIALAICGTVFFLKNSNSNKIKKESNVVTNEKTSTSFSDMQAKTNASKIGVKINKNIVFNSGNSTGNILLENTSSNKNSFIIRLCVEETGEEIYKSELIEYGTRIDEINLDKPLEKGKYNVVAYLTAYDSAGDIKGTSGLNVTVNILN
ncbi:MAG: hypothetical protein GX309_03495 [Clostridiales bacterium]|nr:hypothetical protein [Clostridiales bacterium]